MKNKCNIVCVSLLLSLHFRLSPFLLLLLKMDMGCGSHDIENISSFFFNVPFLNEERINITEDKRKKLVKNKLRHSLVLSMYACMCVFALFID